MAVALENELCKWRFTMAKAKGDRNAKGGNARRRIVVELQEMAEESQPWEQLNAYLFDRSNRLIDRQPLKPDPEDSSRAEVQFEQPLEPGQMVKIGPIVEDVAELDRYRRLSQRVTDAPLRLILPHSLWICWLKVPYLVTGTVVKQENGNERPVCVGEVDIYDVDLHRCFLHLPDLVIERIRNGILDIVVDPPPLRVWEHLPWPHELEEWQGIGPRPQPRPEVNVARKLADLPVDWAWATPRLGALETARDRLDEQLGKLAFSEKQSILSTEVVGDVRLSQIAFTSTAQLRNILVEHFQAFRFYLCWYPWIYWLWWPYCWWYSLEKLGTATLNPDGTFSEVVWLSVCRHDTPDLWFVVRQQVGGPERVIYARHPVPCNTYWNHPSGSPVHLVVTDPQAFACADDPNTDLDPNALWVIPLAIGNYSLKRVYGTGAGSLPADNAKIGLYESIGTGLGGTISTFNDGPFGRTLGLRLLFSPALETAGIKYYRIKRRINNSGSWEALTHDVVRHYSSWNPATSSIDLLPYQLGQQTVGSENHLFEIPPQDPPNAATDPSAAWQVVDAKVDLMNGFFLSGSEMTHGTVEFKLELFDSSGNRIDPAGTGINFYLPSNTDVWNTVTTEAASSVNAALVGADPEAPAFQVFRFSLRIDNRGTVAVVSEPYLNPSSTYTDICGMLRYNPTDTGVTMPYQARHPARFAMYRFRLIKSNTEIHRIEGQAGDMGPSGQFSYSASLATLLGSCTEAAFSENLHVWNMAFNGWHRVGADAGDVRAFALAEA
jgi:hypothetical protein